MTDTGDAVTAYWAAVEVRDWDTFGALLAEDVVYEVPQTRERVRGRAAFTAFTDAGVSQPGLTFFEFGPYGLISRITDYWPEPYEPPAGRAGLAERY